MVLSLIEIATTYEMILPLSVLYNKNNRRPILFTLIPLFQAHVLTFDNILLFAGVSGVYNFDPDVDLSLSTTLLFFLDKRRCIA